MTEPPPPWRMWGMACLQHRNTDVRLTSWTRRQTSMPVSRIESSSGGEIPALLKATCTPPYASTAVPNSAATWASSVTSTGTNRPPTSSAALRPPASSTSPTTTRAPSAARRRTDASPIPLAPPVTTATRSVSRSMDLPLGSGAGGGRRVGGDEDVLDLGERVEGVGPQLPPQARALEPAERRPVPHRGMRVDRQVAALDPAGDPQRAAHVLGPDRAGQP